MSTPSPQGYRLRLGSLSLAMLLPSLGISIANVALPSIKTTLDASTADVQWVVIAYLMALTASLVAAGRLGDLFGRRRLLLAGTALFTLAAAVAALAPGLWALVLARAAQGIGAAVMMSLTIAAVGDMVPIERTGSAMGLLGTVSAIGTALGPSLGGVLIAWFGWPSVFAVMALTGAASLALSWRLLPRDQASGIEQQLFDLAGALLLIAASGAFALATTLRPLALTNAIFAALAVAAAIGFFAVETKTRSPLVQLQMLREPAIGAGLLSIGLVSAIVMTTLVVGPFYLSDTLGLGPAATGLVMSIGPAVSALVGVPAGRLVDRFGSRRAIFSGLGGVLTGTLLMAGLAPVLGVPGYAGSLVVITSGYALFQAANNTAVMGGAGAGQRGVTSALLALARNLGLVTGASAMGGLFTLGSAGLPMLHLAPGGRTGLQLAFAIAAILAGLAILAWRRR